MMYLSREFYARGQNLNFEVPSHWLNVAEEATVAVPRNLPTRAVYDCFRLRLVMRDDLKSLGLTRLSVLALTHCLGLG
jgi:hypothetical protein